MDNLILSKKAGIPDNGVPSIGACSVGVNTMVVQYGENRLYATLYYSPKQIPLWSSLVGVELENVGLQDMFERAEALFLAAEVLNAFYKEFTLQEGLLSEAVNAGNFWASPEDLAASIIMASKAMREIFLSRFGVDADDPDAIESVVGNIVKARDRDEEKEEDDPFDSYLNSEDYEGDFDDEL